MAKPKRITIPFPQVIPQNTGKNSTSGAPVMSVRMSSIESVLIEKICKKLDMTYSNYLRWCGVEVAKQLKTIL